jgi:hypothetical protein
MDMKKLKSDVEKSLSSGLLGTGVLLGNLRLIDEDSRRSPQYQDPKYLPFYYHLAKQMSPSSVLNVGFNLALPLCCFLKGSSSVSSAVGLQPLSSEFYSPRLALANIRDIKGRRFPVDFHLGRVTDEEFARMVSVGVDLAMVTEKIGSGLLDVLEVCWQNLNLDGFILLDRAPPGSPEGVLFSDFCRSKNRDSVFFGTRYGTALAMK